MKTLIFVILIGMATSSLWAQSAAVVFSELDFQLNDACTGGNPLPDGTVVRIYWDNDSNGPDADDPQPPLCNHPPECPDGDIGEWNLNEFLMNGTVQELGDGFFYMEVAFSSVGLVPSPPRYYLRICMGPRHWVSNVVTVVSGPQDVEIASWTCNEAACPGCEFPPAPTSFLATDTNCDSVVMTWTFPASGTVGDFFRIKRDSNSLATIARVNGQTNYRYTDLTAASGISYTYQVDALHVCPGDTGRSSSTYESGQRPPIPSTPTNVRADSSCSGNVHVVWTYGQVFTGRWRVLRNGVVVDTSVIAQGPLGDRSVILSNQVGRAQYCVTAVGSGGCISAAVCDSGGMSGGIPPQVTGVNATDGTICDTTQITWVDVAGETGYRVLRDAVIITNVGAGVTVYNDVTASCGTTFTYTIVAFAGCGGGTPSTGNTGFRNCVPAVVTSLTATDGAYCDSTVLTWNNVTNETRYRIYRRLTGIDPYVKIDSVLADVVTYRDVSGTPGTIYDYQVRPINNCGEAVLGHPTNSGFRRAQPLQVLGVSASNDLCTQVFVSWNTQAAVDSFRILRDSYRIGSVTGAANSYSDTTASPGQSAAYSVVSFSGCGVAPPSAEDIGIRLTLPEPVLNLTSTAECSFISLTWDPVPGALSYSLTRDGSILISGLTETVLDYNPGDYSVHVYGVHAVNVCGLGMADTQAVAMLRITDNPTNLSASDNLCNSILIAWSNPIPNGSSNYIWRDGSQIAVIAGTINYFLDTTAAPGSSHYYFVRSENQCGVSGFSNTDWGYRVNQLSILSPNGGETWRVNEAANIVWECYDQYGPPINIYIDRNYPSGNWELLIGAIPNDGTEDVIVTGPASSNCIVRIATIDNSISDISNAPFAVVSPGYLALVKVSAPTVPIISWNAGMIECPQQFAETFRLKNFGMDAIVVFRPDEPSTNEFSRGSSCAAFFALAPGQSTTCVTTLSFDASHDGVFRDTLLIASDADNAVSGYVRIPLQGEQISTPAIPEVVIRIINDNAVLHWDSVTESTGGCAMAVTGYLVFYAPTLSGPYYYHGFTTDTTYTHSRVAHFNFGMFYRVVATTEPLLNLHTLPPGVCETEIYGLLKQ